MVRSPRRITSNRNGRQFLSILIPQENDLLVGTEIAGEDANRHATIQLWDIEANPAKLLSERAMNEDRAGRRAGQRASSGDRGAGKHCRSLFL